MINLKHLLSESKFIPIYLGRNGLNKDALGPHSVELHWTSSCNYDCVHCSYGMRRSEKERLALSPEVIDSVINDLLVLKAASVYISGGGEPTLIKRWATYIETLIAGNIEVALITNGVAINDSNMDIIRRLNYIAISVYSVSEDEYKQITGSSFFGRQFLLPEKIKKGDSATVVGARCVLNSINYKNMPAIYDRAMDSGYDYIIFIPAVDYEGRGIELGKEEMVHIKTQIEDNYHKFDFKRTNLDIIQKRNISYYGKNDYRDDFIVKPERCYAIEIRGNAFINYDGGVYLCQPHIGNERYCIGNINEAGLKDIWNSQRHRKVLEKLNRDFSSGLCKNCRSISFNRKADEYIHSASKAFEIVKDKFI